MPRQGRRKRSNRFVVPRQRADRTSGIGCAARVRPDNPEAAVVDPEPGAVARVRWLYPGVSAIEREVDARNTYTRREGERREGRVVTRVVSFHINDVVRPSGQDVRMSCIYCKRRLVLAVLRGWRRRTANADQCLSADGDRNYCRCRNKRACGRDAHNGEGTAWTKPTRSFHIFLRC